MLPALRLVSGSGDFSSGVGESGGSIPRPGNGAKHKSTVLIVEDEVLTRMAIADYLRHGNYRVLEASSAEEARAVLKAGEPIEIVFSDVIMPGKMNGFELAHWIRTEYPDVKVLLTSDAVQLPKLHGYGLEAGPVLQKPYAYETVLAHIKRMLMR